MTKNVPICKSPSMNKSYYIEETMFTDKPVALPQVAPDDTDDDSKKEVQPVLSQSTARSTGVCFSVILRGPL